LVFNNFTPSNKSKSLRFIDQKKLSLHKIVHFLIIYLTIYYINGGKEKKQYILTKMLNYFTPTILCVYLFRNTGTPIKSPVLRIQFIRF